MITQREATVLCLALILNAVRVWRREHPKLPSVDCGMAGGLVRW